MRSNHDILQYFNLSVFTTQDDHNSRIADTVIQEQLYRIGKLGASIFRIPFFSHMILNIFLKTFLKIPFIAYNSDGNKGFTTNKMEYKIVVRLVGNLFIYISFISFLRAVIFLPSTHTTAISISSFSGIQRSLTKKFDKLLTTATKTSLCLRGFDRR